MDTPAAFRATYSDLKFIRSRKVAQIVLELPIEQADAFVSVFGAPNPASETWCAIARLNAESASDTEKRKFSDLPIAQQAALLCDRSDFRLFIRAKGFKVTDSDGVASALRELCGVKSRSELATNYHAGGVFQALKREFLDWTKCNLF